MRPVGAGEIECFLDVFDAAWGFARDDEQRQQKTTVALTSHGRKALGAYTQALRDLLGGL